MDQTFLLQLNRWNEEEEYQKIIGAVEALPEEKRPAACIGCRSCEAVCPQQLKISEALADFARKLG